MTRLPFSLEQCLSLRVHSGDVHAHKGAKERSIDKLFHIWQPTSP